LLLHQNVFPLLSFKALCFSSYCIRIEKFSFFPFSFYCILSLRRVFTPSSTIPTTNKPLILTIMLFIFLPGLLFRWEHLSKSFHTLWVHLRSRYFCCPQPLLELLFFFIRYFLFFGMACLAIFSCCYYWRANVIFLFYCIDNDLD